MRRRLGSLNQATRRQRSTTEWIRLLIFVAALAATTRPACAGDLSQDVRDFSQEVVDAQASFNTVSEVAWAYDNLRPTLAKAVWPQGTIFRPAEAPVVHLSPRSVRYRWLVGQMAYWDAVCCCGRQCLTHDPLKGAAVDEDVKGKLLRLEKEWVYAEANYARACAWAWPYSNLRPLACQRGFEPPTVSNPQISAPAAQVGTWARMDTRAHIINPLIPVTPVVLPPSEPDYQLIVAQLKYWGPAVRGCAERLDNLVDSHKPGKPRAGGAKKPAVKKGLPLRPEDARLARMFDIRRKLKSAWEERTAAQQELAALAAPWQMARGNCTWLQTAAQQLRRQIFIMEQPIKERPNGSVAAGLRNNLASMQPEIARAQRDLGKMERQIKELRKKQSQAVLEADDLMEEWIGLCDLFGRLGPRARCDALPVFDQWIADEPELWQPYLARGVARLHLGQYDGALADLRRADAGVRECDPAPRAVGFVMAVRAYALCKQDNVGEGEKMFTEAKKQDKKSWAPHFVRGWSNLQRANYSAAKADFEMTLQLSKDAPKAETHEAMALLLAACPRDRVRDGEKAVEHAAEACDLVEEPDWICLDTLGAAHAEAGGFDSAVKSANKALKLAPTDSQELIRERIELYRAKRPYRLKWGGE